jgi:uncharacterized protein YjbJ (UPF0337 family)
MNLPIPSLVRRLRTASIALLAPIAILVSLLLGAHPVQAQTIHAQGIHAQLVAVQPARPNHAILPSHLLGAMGNKLDARAKQTEGKLESAYGELTGDTGHQIKGKAKQVQGSAQSVAEDVKDGARSVGKKIATATD